MRVVPQAASSLFQDAPNTTDFLGQLQSNHQQEPEVMPNNQENGAAAVTNYSTKVSAAPTPQIAGETGTSK